MSDPVALPPQMARVLRRLRIAYRADAEVYPVLIALEELAVAGAGQELAIANGSRDDQRVTVLQAARKAGVSARTICRAIDSGKLEAHKSGPIWQISERSLARYVAARKRQERQAS